MRALAMAALGLVCACSTQSRAQMLEVAPVSITLQPQQRTASLTVTNHGSAATLVQIRPFLWRESDGTSALSDTAALAASPPFAEIPPGQSQSIRLLLRDLPTTQETTYRLLIDQLPPRDATGIRVALRLSLPVFAQPNVQSAAALEWRILRGRSSLELDVHNRGNRHATIVKAQVSAPSGTSIPVRTATHPYVLAGAEVHWPIEGARLPNSGSVRLTFTTDTGVQETTASIVSAPP